MKITYIFDVNNKHTFAAKTVANGFRNAFLDKGANFSFFDVTKLNSKFGFYEKTKLLWYNPDLILTSMEYIHFLPKGLDKHTKLVLWGQFYSPCDYEAQIHHVSSETKNLLQKLSSKHDILIWSQHDDEINEQFYSGYTKEMGLTCIQLLHVADKTKFTMPSSASPEYDFMWIGNYGHRKDQYDAFINPLKQLSKNYLDFTEHNKGNPLFIEGNKLYSRSCVIPNIHTSAQVKHRILINERVFTAAMLGGFQLCDNPLARKYFPEQELHVAEKPTDFIELFNYYKQYPEKRLPFVLKMQDNILKNHTYHNRVEAILSVFHRD